MASLVDRYFSEPDFKAIEAAVKRAELSTSGEIAVELASRVRNWTGERLWLSLSLAVLGALVALLTTRDTNWGVYYDTTQATLWGVVGFVAGYFALGQLLRRSDRRREAVWQRARQRFDELTPVRNLAGVLIFVSIEEREAALVADTGIAEKLPPDYWQQLRARMISQMMQGKHAETIIQTIEEIASQMARHFPRLDGDVNELPDRPTRLDS